VRSASLFWAWRVRCAVVYRLVSCPTPDVRCPFPTPYPHAHTPISEQSCDSPKSCHQHQKLYSVQHVVAGNDVVVVLGIWALCVCLHTPTWHNVDFAMLARPFDTVYPSHCEASCGVGSVVWIELLHPTRLHTTARCIDGACRANERGVASCGVDPFLGYLCVDQWTVRLFPLLFTCHAGRERCFRFALPLCSSLRCCFFLSFFLSFCFVTGGCTL